MKYFVLISVFFLMETVSAKEPDTNSDRKNNKGIEFHSGSWEEALAQAKKEDKAIFLDISASWCGPCKMLKANTFINKDVGDYYNENFINVMVDGEKGEGISLARKFRISGYPTMIYLNSAGELIARTSGYREPAVLIEMGKQVLGQQTAQ